MEQISEGYYVMHEELKHLSKLVEKQLRGYDKKILTINVILTDADPLCGYVCSFSCGTICSAVCGPFLGIFCIFICPSLCLVICGALCGINPCTVGCPFACAWVAYQCGTFAVICRAICGLLCPLILNQICPY